MAELHGPEPVELEVSVEVAASSDPLEGEGASRGTMGCPQQPQNQPKWSHNNQLGMGMVVCSTPFVEKTGEDWIRSWIRGMILDPGCWWRGCPADTDRCPGA